MVGDHVEPPQQLIDGMLGETLLILALRPSVCRAATR